jgi:hypothetical protein
LEEGISTCGIFGSIATKGNRWNVGIIRALAIANEQRGSDSVGFFDSTMRIIKAAVTPSDGIRQKNISAWLERSNEESWAIGGHTRFATQGSVSRKNSHPFRYGNIVGSHNGCIESPDRYAVDSQYLFDSLNKAKGDYNKAWSEIVGYWAVSYFDGENFYLQVHNGELHVCEYRGCYYYSSSAKHLESCVGFNTTIRKIAEGETLKFSPDESMTVVAPFVSTAPDYWIKKYGCSNANCTIKGGKVIYYNNKGVGNFVDRGTVYDDEYSEASSNVKEYDSSWKEAWAAYSSMEDTDDGQKS